MVELWNYVLENLGLVPSYLGFFVTGMVMLAIATPLYKWVTPYNELELIRNGNKSAALSLGGFVIGFAVALHTIAAGTGFVFHLVLWGVMALITQLIVFWTMNFVLKNVKENIESDNVAYGIILGAAHVATGIINASALTA